MRVIKYFYSNQNRWIDVLAEAMGGTVDGNFINGDNEIYSGRHFILPLDDNISAMLADVTYKENSLLEFRNDVENFVGLYFHITNHDVNFILNDESALLGTQDYNLSIVDSTIDIDYVVEKGTNTFVLCVFINKVILQNYIDKVPELKSLYKDIFNAKKNTIIVMDRMSNECSILINDFRKIEYDNPLFEFYFRGLIYRLIGKYLDQLLAKKSIISKVMGDDVKRIIASKAMLLGSIEGIFPGIDFLAEKVAMSPSKYKKQFTKISGLSPGAFFYNNKLQRAKELLESGQYTVSEVSDKLNYANISYLAKRFNSQYGIFPKEYQNLL